MSNNFDQQDIENILTNFYTKVMKDIMISFQFQKIANTEDHFNRIKQFWCNQILKESLSEIKPPIELFEIHVPLQMKIGHLHRWVTLFNESLDEYRHPGNGDSINAWKKKIEHFQQQFLMNPKLFTDKDTKNR